MSIKDLKKKKKTPLKKKNHILLNLSEPIFLRFTSGRDAVLYNIAKSSSVAAQFQNTSVSMTYVPPFLHIRLHV